MVARVALLLAAAASAATFRWPVPEGWKAETIPFPLEFAKELPYTGVEELRFAPGMFAPEADGYWSYAFVWWLDGHPPLGAREIEDDLRRYFSGLSNAVGKEKGFAIDPDRFAASVKAGSSPASRRGHTIHAYAGTVNTYDPFATGKPIVLNVLVWVWDCDAAGRRAALVLASPKDRGAPIWQSLEKRRDEFVCH